MQTSTNSSENNEDVVVRRTKRNALGPRFEKKVTAVKKHFNCEGEICETEELEDGFTKITSKNLDILFKREYYEQRKAQEDSKECPEEFMIEETEENDFKGELGDQTDEKSESEKSLDNMSESNTSLRSSFDQINLSDIQEFQPMNSLESFPDMTCHPYSSSYQYQGLESAQPCLYLYSPRDNSLMPCEKIIIPHHGMPGTTNIYLAYTDSRGCITHQYNPPSSYISQDSAYSTTPEDSEPSSPPSLVNYHPTNTDKLDKETREAIKHKTTTTQETVKHIPGLVFKEDNNQKKTMKKRKKKLKGESIMKDVSSCPYSDMQKLDNQTTNDDPSPHGDDTEDDPIQEIFLTDDLANCLVNPPTGTHSFDDVAFVEHTKIEEDLLIFDANLENYGEAEHEKSTVVDELSKNACNDPSETVKTNNVLKSVYDKCLKKDICEKLQMCQDELVEPKFGNSVQKKKSRNRKREICLQEDKFKVEDVSHATSYQLQADMEKSYSSATKIISKEPTNLTNESLHTSGALHDIPETVSDNFADKVSVKMPEIWIQRISKRRKNKNRLNNDKENPLIDMVAESNPITFTEVKTNDVEEPKKDTIVEVNDDEEVKKRHRKKKTPLENVDRRSDVRKIMICDDQVSFLWHKAVPLQSVAVNGLTGDDVAETIVQLA